MKRFRVTYEIVTPDSAEHGEAEEIGFVMPGNWHDTIEVALKEPDGAYDMSLGEALGLIGCVENTGQWYSETDSRTDYATGAEERRALHLPENITPSSRKRVERLLKAEGLL